MGLLDDYAPDFDEIPDGPDYNVPDGTYDFEIGNFYRQDGTSKNPDAQYLVVEYLLGDEGKRSSEWFGLPEDPSSPTDKEIQKLSFLKRRFQTLGVPRDRWNSIDEDDLIGITGVLTLRTRNGYQNVSSLSVDEAPAAVEEKPRARAAKTAAGAAANAASARKAETAEEEAEEPKGSNQFAGAGRRRR